MSTKAREAFEAYWSERQRITHPYTHREVPEGWGAAFKPDAWKAWQASRQAAMEEAAKLCDKEADEGEPCPMVSPSWVDGARDCAAAIRALIAKPAEGEA
jgi:hypothetical protein